MDKEPCLWQSSAHAIHPEMFFCRQFSLRLKGNVSLFHVCGLNVCILLASMRPIVYLGKQFANEMFENSLQTTKSQNLIHQRFQLHDSRDMDSWATQQTCCSPLIKPNSSTHLQLEVCVAQHMSHSKSTSTQHRAWPCWFKQYGAPTLQLEPCSWAKSEVHQCCQHLQQQGKIPDQVLSTFQILCKFLENRASHKIANKDRQTDKQIEDGQTDM